MEKGDERASLVDKSIRLEEVFFPNRRTFSETHSSHQRSFRSSLLHPDFMKGKLAQQNRLSGPESWVFKSHQNQGRISQSETSENDANASMFKQIIVSLMEMGFPAPRVHRFVEHLAPKTIEEALE